MLQAGRTDLFVRPTASLAGGGNRRPRSVVSQHRRPLSSTAPLPALNVPQLDDFSKVSSDISTMLSIREKMLSLFEKCVNVLTENRGTPDIQRDLMPPLHSIETTYPVFHKQGTHYFAMYLSMQESGKKNQVLSSSSVRFPLQAFLKDWRSLCKVIDHFATVNPPPHAKEIAAKFNGIRSSLDVIKKSNEHRKFPCVTIDPCIANILALGKSLAKNINHLFEAPYTEFQGNLYKGFKRDVQSFLTVVNEAFINEFVQSGIMLCDLPRLRSNIVTDCGEIIQFLRAAFIFPVHMKEIQMMKDMTEGELKGMVQKLSVPFVVVRRDGAAETIETRDIAQLTDPEEDDDAEVFEIPDGRDYLYACNRIDGFLADVFTALDLKWDESRDTWEKVDELADVVKAMRRKRDQDNAALASVSREMEKLNERSSESEVILTQKVDMLKHIVEANTTKISELNLRIAHLNAENGNLERSLAQVKEELEVYRLADIDLLRATLDGCSQMIDKRAASLLGQSDHAICTTVLRMLRDKLDTPCMKCVTWELQIEGVKGQLQELTGSREQEIRGLVALIKQQYVEYEQKILDVQVEVQDGKAPVVAAIGILTSTNDDSLFQKSPDELARALHRAAATLIEKDTTLKESFEKREEQYMKLFEQIEGKLLKLLDMPPIQSEGQSLASERKRVIDSISAALKSIVTFNTGLQKAVKDRDAAILAAAEKHATFENDIRAAMQIGLSPNVPESCLRKLESLKHGYEKEINILKFELETARTDSAAIELRISGICNQPGTVYEMLSHLQDEREQNALERKRMQNVLGDYRRCIEAVAQIILTDEHLVEMTIEEIVTSLVAFCNNPHPLTVAISWIGETFAEPLKLMEGQDPAKPQRYLPRIATRFAEFLAFEQSFAPLNGIVDGGVDKNALEEAFDRAKVLLGRIVAPTGMEKGFRGLLTLLDRLAFPVEPREEFLEEEVEEEDAVAGQS
jgi:hypothetical protein